MSSDSISGRGDQQEWIAAGVPAFETQHERETLLDED